MRGCGDADRTTSGCISVPRSLRISASPHLRIPSFPLHQLDPIPERIVHVTAIEARELLGGDRLVAGGFAAGDEWSEVTDEKRRVREGQLPLVDNETYLRRAGTCLNCPFKQGLDEGCGSCRSAIKQLRREVIDGRPEYAGLLMTGCQILGTDLPTAVHLDEITVDNKQLPDNCWRKRTIT